MNPNFILLAATIATSTAATCLSAFADSATPANATVVPANPSYNPKAARSVHLQYPAPEGTLFYNEVTVEETVPGSYFMTCGFSRGYFGIQDLGDGSRRILFSVWDSSKGNDPKAVQQSSQVEVLAHGDGVTVKRFGGEGTGGQSFLSYAWQLGHTYKCVVAAKVEGDKTVYSGYFFIPEQDRWQLMASFRTTSGGAPLKGLYSFVEDFRRDGQSAGQIRRARFGNGWVQSTSGDWVSLCRARFTADGNTQMHIDAAVTGDTFSLQNGGATKNVTPLKSTLERLPQGVSLPPDVSLTSSLPPIAGPATAPATAPSSPSTSTPSPATPTKVTPSTN